MTSYDVTSTFHQSLVGGGLACLAAAFVAIAAAPAATPAALEAVKAVTVTAVIGCAVLADTATAATAAEGPGGAERPAVFVAAVAGAYTRPLLGSTCAVLVNTED
jgi:hypothetical protein